MASPKQTLRAVDDNARRLAKTLLRTARYAGLGHLDVDDGSPVVSRVNVATCMDGRIGFLISELSPHFDALVADPRCSVLLGEPGKGDPIAHPRLTIIGRAHRIVESVEQQRFASRFLRKHPKSSLYAEFADFAYWRLTPQRALLNGGFGKAYELTQRDIQTNVDGLDDLEGMEVGAITHMNEDHRDAIDLYSARLGLKPMSGWELISLDPEGFDLAQRDETARLWFDCPIKSADELRPVLISIAREARLGNN